METAKGKPRQESATKLAETIDGYEKYSRSHARAMAEVAALVARRLGLAQPDINALAEAAMLHDIGLYAMNPPYHSSPGPLSFAERIDLWRHSVIGEQQMAKRGLTRHAQLLVRWHHEWWNGTGYPDSLSFEDIPIGARILRAVELLSALADDRPYRAALSFDDAIETLKSSAGVECDPAVVSALIALIDELRETIEPEAETSPSIEPSLSAEPPLLIESGRIDQPPQTVPTERSEAESKRSVSDLLTAYPSFHPKEAAQTSESSSTSNSLHLSLLLSRYATRLKAEEPQWSEWKRSRYNKKSLLGFQASVLRQIEFRSIAVGLCGWARMEWYLKAWNKLIFSNDPRAWAASVSRAMIEARAPMPEDQVAALLSDVYIPGNRLMNAGLLRWFSETDAWWMDNLRRNIESIEDEMVRAQAIYLGLQVGDYALSFDDRTRDLRRPLATVFWRLAGRAMSGPPGQPHSRSYNLAVEEFARQSRADLFYLNLPPAHGEQAGSEARNLWRESWVRCSNETTTDEIMKLSTTAQSKHTYLSMVERILRAASNAKIWAIEYQDIGLASAQDISELIKEHREVRATYSKDLTEVAGGLRNYIFVAEKV
ncbi:MAG: HD domain-containing phosphohydrolase [Acidobacteriota bacterium]